MRFKFTSGQDTWRREVQQFLNAELDPAREAPFDIINYSEDWDYQVAFGQKLARKGWIAPAWPREYGGMGLGHIEQMIYTEESAYFRAPQGGRNIGVSLLAPALINHGSDEQRQTHLAKIASNEILWCQGYSEPDAGSDLASVSTRAVRSGDDYLVTGHKIWTSNAHRAQWMFLLARTDPSAPKHKGISFLLLDMQSPGIEIHPIANLAGSRDFYEVYLRDVRVPLENRVGEENRGWYVAMTVLNFERSFIRASAGAHRTLTDIWQNADLVHSSARRLRLVDLLIENEVARIMNYRVGFLQASEVTPIAEASATKVMSTEHMARVYQFGVECLGLNGQLLGGRAPLGGRIAVNLMTSRAGSIYSGTNEVQRNLIADKGLGLPRSPSASL